MGKQAPKAPTPPDPNVVANAQSTANIASATAQQKLNMVNTSDPYGSVNYSADPSAPGGYRQTTTLSPGQQGLYDLGNQAELGALGIANDQLGRISGALGQGLSPPTLQSSFGPTDFTADRNAITDAMYGQARSRLDPQWQTAENQDRTRLANQGLSQNSSAYQTEMGAFGRNKNDAYNSALNSAILSGANEQNVLFNQAGQQATFGNQAAQQGFQNQAYAQNQPIDQFGALMSGGQVQTPGGINYTPSQVGQTDVTGAYGLNMAQQNANYQGAMQTYGQQMSGLYNLGGAALMAFSDLRLKTGLRFLGKRNGLGVYAFRYIWAPLIEYIGVMAQEVLGVKPDAVHVRDGFLAVDYGAL
jgi:hypothetical protein